VLTTIPTTLLSLASSGAVLLTQPVDPTTPPMLGIDPVYLYAAATLACGGLGYLVGPSIGTFFWNVVHKRDRKNVEAMDSVFWSKIERNRVDPSRQTMQNRLPDFYVSGRGRECGRWGVHRALGFGRGGCSPAWTAWTRCVDGADGAARPGHGRVGHEEAALRLLPPHCRRLLLSGQALCISAGPLRSSTLTSCAGREDRVDPAVPAVAARPGRVPAKDEPRRARRPHTVGDGQRLN